MAQCIVSLTGEAFKECHTADPMHIRRCTCYICLPRIPICIHVCLSCMRSFVYALLNNYYCKCFSNTHLHLHTHLRTHTCAHTHTHTHLHTHTHRPNIFWC